MKESELSFGVGEKVQSTKLFSWTVDEFEDFPLVVEPGQTGIVKEILDKHKIIYVAWDNDEYPERIKSLTFEEAIALKKVEEQDKPK